MRAVTGLIALTLAAIATSVLAQPRAAPGYRVDVVRMPGAIFAGLARDGEGLLVTNLADGRLYRFASGGGFAPFGPMLPHGTDAFGDPTGPYRVARHGNSYLVAQGWPPADQAEQELDHALLEVDESAVVRVVSNDFWNPYDFVSSNDSVYVVDAARNAVERLSLDGSGKVRFFTFARLTARGEALGQLSPTEFGGGSTYEFDAVPTGIAAHGGRIYVSLLGGFPFIAGSGRIVSLPETGMPDEARSEADDLNSPVDIAFDAKGEMLVLEHGTFDQLVKWNPGSGRLVAIDPATNERSVILAGLTRPVAVLPFDDDTIVVSQLDGQLVFVELADEAGGGKPRQ
jgi:hypothetical protein